MRLLKIYLFALLISSNQILVAQEDAADSEAPSTVQQLLELVKEGQVREQAENAVREAEFMACLLYTSPSPRDATLSRMPSSA